jgi:DDE family transposase
VIAGTRRAGRFFRTDRIKEGKTATQWTRLSYHRFRANEVRLLLGVIAYNLGNVLRRLVLPVTIRDWSLTSLQQRLFKTGGRLIRHARYFTLSVCRKLLDGGPLPPDPHAHGAAGMASDMIELSAPAARRATEVAVSRRSVHEREDLGGSGMTDLGRHGNTPHHRSRLADPAISLSWRRSPG